MRANGCYEEYPLWIVLLSNSVTCAIYAIGAFVMYSIGLAWLLLYILYIVWLEIRVLRISCVNCYYYGKTCAFGKGKLVRLFSKKGNPEEFTGKRLTWKDILPDFMVSLIPMIAAVVLLILDFNWLLLSFLFLLLLLTLAGNGFIRGSLACRYCQQREIGCPAQQLFNRKSQDSYERK
ncbi:MAG: hypothetical protein A2144_12125 [Chloroflexi bacterium RBG_16_50_9]|nr:MAG: hypothetical protein A2144_12125 [Chloroflexi bacterium RBG_16_50_9]